MVEPHNLLILSNISGKSIYLNVLVDLKMSHVGMAEWLTQFTDTKRPSGLMGLIPVPDVTLLIQRKSKPCT